MEQAHDSTRVHIPLRTMPENVASCLLLRGGFIAKEHVIQRVQGASTMQLSASLTCGQDLVGLL